MLNFFKLYTIVSLRKLYDSKYAQLYICHNCCVLQLIFLYVFILSRSENIDGQMESVSCGSPQELMYHSTICKICLKEKIEVMFIPCGHVIACIECSVTLNNCAICRQVIQSFMKVFLYVDEEKENYPNQLDGFSSQGSDERVDPALCKICRKEEMGIAFVPCRHVCACFECAKKMKECPVCFEPFFAFIQVFL